MFLEWQEWPHHSNALSPHGCYEVSAPDSTGWCEVKFNAGDGDVYVGKGFGQEDAKVRADEHAIWLKELVNRKEQSGD